MAKKKPANFKMAEAIRTILGENPKLSGKEAQEVLQAKHPDAKVNENSFSVAFYSARKKLGIASRNGRGGTKVVKKRLPSAPAARPTVNLATLQAAAKFLSEAGNAETAIEAIKQVKGLQVTPF